MKKMIYESPELDIRWFETEDICSPSNGLIDPTPGDSIVDDDDWGSGDDW